MKILHVIDLLGFGGAQTILKAIMENTANSGDVYAFVLRKAVTQIELAHPNVIIMNSGKRFSLSPIKEIVKIIKLEKIDVLHCQLFRSQFFGWLIKLLYFKNIKLVFHEHGQIMGTENKNWLEDFVFCNFIKLAKKRVNKFIAISNITKTKLIERTKVDENRIYLLYNFIDNKHFDRNNIKTNAIERRTKFNISPNDFVVGFAGRLNKRKGWEDFVDSFQFIKKNKNIKFLIAGDGIDKPLLLNKLENKSLNDHIIYLGYVDDMLNNFYSIVDCVVFPSHWEPMGLIQLECFSLQIPVIASNVAGLNEIVKHQENGLLFEAKNILQLAKSIEMYYNDKDLIKNITKIASIDLQKYSLENYLIKLDKLYFSL